MLDVKSIRPKTRQKAVYVTEDNVKEFLEYAYPGAYNLDTLIIDKDEYPYIYASVKYSDPPIRSSHFILNEWYVNNGHYWYDDEYFADKYEIESSRMMEVK